MTKKKQIYLAAFTKDKPYAAIRKNRKFPMLYDYWWLEKELSVKSRSCLAEELGCCPEHIKIRIDIMRAERAYQQRNKASDSLTVRERLRRRLNGNSVE